MKKLLEILYNAWVIFWIILIFLILYPFMVFGILIKKLLWVHGLFQFWAKSFFWIIGKPIQKEYRYKPAKDQAYVFVANHFSYLDIAAGMEIVDNYFAYVGKSSVRKVPLLGYVFRKLHIAVDRSNKNSRSITLKRGIAAIKNGQSIFIMPEGGIISQTIPKMHQPFKDGAFVMAIENQVPIVPITFKNLYDIMPQSKMKSGIPKVVFHEPIPTKGLDKSNINDLKSHVYQVIQGELDAYYSTTP